MFITITTGMITDPFQLHFNGMRIFPNFEKTTPEGF